MGSASDDAHKAGGTLVTGDVEDAGLAKAFDELGLITSG